LVHFSSVEGITQESPAFRHGEWSRHVFSYKKLPCLEGKAAMRAFHKENRFICYLFYQEREEAYMLVNAEILRAEDLRQEHDVYVVDPQFMWTYVQTHEYYCGPYFYRKYSQESFRFNE
jgi:hypothetical protein